MLRTKKEIMDNVAPMLEKMTEAELSDIAHLLNYIKNRFFATALIGGGLIFSTVGLGAYLWNEFGKVKCPISFTKK